MIPKHFIPSVGDLFKLRLMEFYRNAGIPEWSWLKTTRVVHAGDPTPTGATYVQDLVFAKVFNGGKEEGEERVFETFLIDPPLYWKPVYTVEQYDPAEFVKVRAWLKAGRGVKVWGCHDLSRAGLLMFTPGDVDGKPHWSMEAVEVIHDPQRLMFTLITKHPLPTGYPPDGSYTPEALKKAEREAKAKRKKALAWCRMGGIPVHNVKGERREILESWYETEISDISVLA